MLEADLHFWDPAKPAGSPAVGTVQIWHLSVSQWYPFLDRLGAMLSTEERQRAGRYLFPQHAHRYTIVHGVLRALLGSMLETAPEAVRIMPDTNGKPHVIQADGQPSSLRFNLSDSGNVALFAMALRQELGVDVEQIRPLDHLKLAQRFFATEEVRDLMRLPANELEAAFFACWTRKEAFLKAMGTGLRTPLDSFAVSVRPDEPAVLRRAAGADRRSWTVHDLSPGKGYAAALVTAGAAPNLTRAALIPEFIMPKVGMAAS